MPPRAKLRIGNALVKGPWTLHEPERVGHGYVESQHSLHEMNLPLSTLRSCRIYCDACGDDEDGFLAPIGRLASWKRLADVKTSPKGWPDVQIERFLLPLDCPPLQSEVRRQQQVVAALTPGAFGLPTRRNFGPGPDEYASHLTVRTNIGWESLKWHGPLPFSSPLADALDRLSGVIRSVGEPLPATAWIECYDLPIDALADGRRWYWDGTPGLP